MYKLQTASDFYQKLYATLPESTHLFNNYNIMRPSQNLPLPQRIYPPFQQIYMCDPPRLYPSLPESTPHSQNPPPHSQNIPPFQQISMCVPPRIYPSLPENNYHPFQQL